MNDTSVMIWIRLFLRLLRFYTKSRHFLVVYDKQRHITHVCLPSFAKWQAALFSLHISLLCVECRWQETPIGQASAGMLSHHI